MVAPAFSSCFASAFCSFMADASDFEEYEFRAEAFDLPATKAKAVGFPMRTGFTGGRTPSMHHQRPETTISARIQIGIS